MRKELIIAIITGVVIGVFLAFGIWRANSAFKSNNLKAVIDTSDSNLRENTTSVESAELTIAEPEENDVITQTPVKLSGITKPTTTLIISGEEEDYVVTSSNNGEFEAEVDLVGGINQIIVAHPANGDVAETKNLTVVFSSEFEKELNDTE